MRKGVKFRIYPNKQQEDLINKTFGCCRLVYNKALDLRIKAYEEGNKVNYFKSCAMLTNLKQTEEFEFLKEVDSISLQQSLKDLDRAYANFFSKRSRFPKFKSKKNNFKSYRTLNAGNKIRIEGKYIKLPKLGFVKVKQSMPIDKIHNVTIEKTPSGKYFAVLNVEFDPEPKSNEGKSVGVDVGIKEYFTDSNGNVYANPKHLEKSMKKLTKEQRKLSRKVAGSSNWNKQRVKVARLYEKVVNQRNDFLHKISTSIVRENQTICVEGLNVKDMMKNRRLALHISSVSWSKFFTMLEYKACWYGSQLIRVPTLYPSSQLCHVCGFKNAEVKNLNIRDWVCPKCGTKHDRDVNAAINILNKGLQIKAESFA